MPEAAQSSVLGRCPTCGQLVTVPGDARSREVACPTCRHQGRAAAFDVAAPLPVIVLPAAAERNGSGLRQANGFEVVAAGEHAAPDEARTHLLLDLPVLEEAESLDPRTNLILGNTARKVGSPRRVPADEARTHLLLDPKDVEDAEASVLAPVPAAPAANGATADDPRTRLMVGPLSARGDQERPHARLLAALNRLVPPTLRLSVRLDEALHGRWLWALAAFAVVCGFIAPSLDYLRSNGGSTITWTFVVLGLGTLGLARLNGLRGDDGKWHPGIAGVRIKVAASLLRDSLERIGQSPRYLRMLLTGEALGLVALSGFIWVGFISGLRLLFGSSASPGALPYLSGLLLVAAVLIVWQGWRLRPTHGFSLEQSGNSLAAAAQLPPILDLSEPLPEAVSGGTTTLHKALVALSQWRPHEWPDEALYRAALERHLQRHLPGSTVERERWVGRSRLDGVIDLVIDGMLVVGVKHGFYKAQAERAVGQMSSYARAWSGKPMVLAIFEAPSEAVFKSASTASLVQLHKGCALVSVRMPTNW